jgi:hypothetical protein
MEEVEVYKYTYRKLTTFFLCMVGAGVSLLSVLNKMTVGAGVSLLSVLNKMTVGAEVSLVSVLNKMTAKETETRSCAVYSSSYFSPVSALLLLVGSVPVFCTYFSPPAPT